MLSKLCMAIAGLLLVTAGCSTAHNPPLASVPPPPDVLPGGVEGHRFGGALGTEDVVALKFNYLFLNQYQSHAWKWCEFDPVSSFNKLTITYRVAGGATEYDAVPLDDGQLKRCLWAWQMQVKGLGWANTLLYTEPITIAVPAAHAHIEYVTVKLAVVLCDHGHRALLERNATYNVGDL
jgi:hypothetical protein